MAEHELADLHIVVEDVLLVGEYGGSSQQYTPITDWYVTMALLLLREVALLAQGAQESEHDFTDLIFLKTHCLQSIATPLEINKLRHK